METGAEGGTRIASSGDSTATSGATSAITSTRYSSFSVTGGSRPPDATRGWKPRRYEANSGPVRSAFIRSGNSPIARARSCCPIRIRFFSPSRPAQPGSIHAVSSGRLPSAVIVTRVNSGARRSPCQATVSGRRPV